MGKKLSIAIVGCGGMGGGHAVAIGSGTGSAIWNVKGMYDKKATEYDERSTDISKKLTLAGVYDIDPARQQWAAEQGFRNYDSFEAVLADENVDIVLVATPNHLHRELSIAAMRAGKHVLCEKPVMLSSEELAEVLAVSKETGKVFYPRQNRRWDKDFLIVKEIYEKQLVGRVFNIESRVLGSRGIPGDWRGVKEYGGGMMLDWGVHLLDRLATMIPERITRVFCSMTHVTNDEVDDGFKMHLTFESGLTAVVEVGPCHFISLPLWFVAGCDGTAEIDDWSCAGKLLRLKSWEDRDAKPILAGEGLTKTMAPRQGTSVETLPLPEVNYDRNELYSNLVDTINGEAEQIVTGEQALRVLQLMEAAFESDRTGRTVEFE